MRNRRRRWPWLLALLAALQILGGCAILPGNPTDMTAEQLKELVKDKNANIGCATVETPYKANVIYLVLDKGIILSGSVVVKSNCEVTITNGPAK